MDNRKYKLIKVLFYSVIIVVFLIIRIIGKSPGEGEKVSLNEIFKDSKFLTETNTSNDTMDDQDKPLYVNNGLSINKYEANPDTDLYTANTDKEVYGDEVFIRFKLINGELLYDRKLPLGIFDKMLENYQEYFNQIEVDAPISEVTIIEDSIQEDKDYLKYDLKTNTNVIISVTVDLHTFEYTFKNKK